MPAPVLKASNDVLSIEELPLESVPGPIYSSPKLDGNRLVIHNGYLYSSSWKTPRNTRLPKALEWAMEWSRTSKVVFDGELYSPSTPHHAELSGCINSYTQYLPTDLQYAVFDVIPSGHFEVESKAYNFEERVKYMRSMASILSNKGVKNTLILPQREIRDRDHLRELYQQDLEDGYEGSMVRPGPVWYDGRFIRGGFYKHGRATNKQCTMWKLKALNTLDGFIIGITERKQLREDWPRERDCYGRLKQPNEKAAFIGGNTLGSFIVRVPLEDKSGFIDTEVMFGKGFNLPWREKTWKSIQDAPDVWFGRWIEFKHLEHGAKKGGKIRHGRLVRMRDDKAKPARTTLPERLHVEWWKDVR